MTPTIAPPVFPSLLLLTDDDCGSGVTSPLNERLHFFDAPVVSRGVGRVYEAHQSGRPVGGGRRGEAYRRKRRHRQKQTAKMGQVQVSKRVTRRGKGMPTSAVEGTHQQSSAVHSQGSDELTRPGPLAKHGDWSDVYQVNSSSRTNDDRPLSSCKILAPERSEKPQRLLEIWR